MTSKFFRRFRRVSVPAISLGIAAVSLVGATGASATAPIVPAKAQPIGGTVWDAACSRGHAVTQETCYAAETEAVNNQPVTALVPIVNGAPRTAVKDAAMPGNGSMLSHSITCRTTSQCVMTGQLPAAGGKVNLALQWLAGTKSTRIVRVPGITGLDGSLNGVACASTTYCVAAGGIEASRTANYGVIVVFNPSTFAMKATVLTNITALSDVACPTLTQCVAVGTKLALATANPFAAVVVAVNSGKVGAPRSFAGMSMTTSISCGYTTVCWVTGTKYSPGQTNPWTSVVGKVTGGLPAKAIGAGRVLDALSCVSASTCYASDATFTPTAVGRVDKLVNGKVVASVALPAFHGLPSALTCPTVHSCLISGTTPDFYHSATQTLTVN